MKGQIVSNIDYKSIYEARRRDWKALTDDESDGKYEMLVAGHYSENNHFVYELLQNAEDEGATRIVFDYFADKLCVYHNGKPFDQKDVEGICSFLEGTKDKDSLQKIGHFGLGFKSVFKYTNRPEVYSNNEAFRIVRYLLPVQIDKGFFPQCCVINEDGQRKRVFSDGEHATMFVLPFKDEIMSPTSSVKPVDIIDKLTNLESEILLFLRSITELRWIDNTTGRHGFFKKEVLENFDRTDVYNICVASCTAFDSLKSKIPAVKKSQKKSEPEPLPYVLLSRKFSINTDRQHDASVSIAYKLNSSKTGIVPIDDAKIWVFFPTRDDSNLPFIIHGTYETPVSREKIMLPSAFNDELLKKTEYLIVDGLSFLKEKNLLSQSYIKQILLPAFDNKRLTRLREKVNTTFTTKAYLPSGKGTYAHISDALVAIPFDMPAIMKGDVFVDTDYTGKCFVDLTDVNNSASYIRWLTNDLRVQIFSLCDFASLLKNKPIVDFGEYHGLLDYIKHVLDYNNYRRNSRYDELLDEGRDAALPILRTAKILLTQASTYSASQDENGKKLLYFDSENDYQSLEKGQIIAKELEEDEEIHDMLEKHFNISSFDNRLYVTQTIIPKYLNLDKKGIHVEDDEHISDIKKILTVINNDRLSSAEISELLKGAYLLAVTSTKDGKQYHLLCCPYFIKASNGIDIQAYFEGVENTYFLRENLYTDNNITREDLMKLGASEDLLEGADKTWGGYYVGNPGRQPEWRTYGEFRWKLTMKNLVGVLLYISNHPEEPSSRAKSAAIIIMLQENERRLTGYLHIGGNTVPNKPDACALIIQILRDRSTIDYEVRKWNGKWLFTKEGNLVTQSEISKYDLDESLYGKLKLDSKLYELLGFMEGYADKAEAALREYSSIPKEKRESFFASAWRSGELKQWISQNKQAIQELSYDETANPDEDDYEFPSVPVKNIDLLRKHVHQAIYSADHVKYEQVLRSIRTSQNANSGREYLISMYSSSSGKCVCQSCQEFGSFEAVQIQKNPTLELDQTYLCLCPTCATAYRQHRNSADFEKRFISKMLAADTSGEEPITVSCENTSVTFTQTHLAEIQEILRIIGSSPPQKV